MSRFKFCPDLFLEAIELNRFADFLDEQGFRKNILENSIAFGLIKNERLDPQFLNARVERDLDTTIGQKTIKIRETKGIDADGNFLYLPETNGIPVPADDSWYWMKIRYNAVSEEVGDVTLSINGDLVGVGTAFTKTLRGLPNFPSRISFPTSRFNKQEYDVIEVVDDFHAKISHPATTTTGIAEFVVEENLKYRVVGTFTPGAAVPNANKFPFVYDACTYTLVKEEADNVIPGQYVAGKEFYIARLKVEGSNVIIQDKRTEVWITQAEYNTTSITTTPNPLIGVESVKWQNPFSPANKNLVQIAWGMRSQNWSVDSSLDTLTLLGGAVGGIFKSIDHFSNGDFDGWRAYFPNGNYRRITSSVKQGQAINLQLEVLNIDDVSADGGATFLSDAYVLVVPDCDTVIIKCTPDPADNIGNVAMEYHFPVNTLFGICELETYKDPISSYNIAYRYKSGKKFTEYSPIPSDNEAGYLTEDSFSNNGNLKPIESRRLQPYNSDAENGFIAITTAPYSYSKFSSKVDKGDMIGVNVISSFANTQILQLRVGKDKNYQYISGNVTISDDVYISLSNDDAVEGNKFRIHFDCASLGLSGKNIYIVRNYAGGSPDTLKKIEQADVWHMLNHDGGLTFDCVFTGSNWCISSNYELLHPFQIGMTDGVITDLFDANGWGKVKGYFGSHLCNGNDDTPNLMDRFIAGAGYTYRKGDTGGAATVKLTVNQMPSHAHDFAKAGDKLLDKVPTFAIANSNYDFQNGPFGAAMNTTGGDEPHENLPPYYALFYFKKMY